MDVCRWPDRTNRRESGGDGRCAWGARRRGALVGARNRCRVRRWNARYRRNQLDDGNRYGRELWGEGLDAHVLIDQQCAMRMLIGSNEMGLVLTVCWWLMAVRGQTRVERAHEREQTRYRDFAELMT